MICQHCRTPVADDAAFCPSCGRSLAASPAAPESPMAFSSTVGTR